MHKRLRRHVEECLGSDGESPPAVRRLLRRVEREYRRADDLRASLRHALGLLAGLLQTARTPRASAPRAARADPPAPGVPETVPAPVPVASLFDQSPMAALLCDADRRITSWNPAAEKLFGIGVLDAVGRELAMLLYPGSDLEEAQARTALRQALGSGDTQRLVLSQRGRDAPARTLEWTLAPMRDAEGNEVGNAALVQERDAEVERSALAWEAAGDVVWDWDLAREALWLSPAWAALLGCKGDSATPSEWLDRIHPDDRGAFAAALSTHLEGATARFENEHRLRHADGSWRWVLARGRATRDADGKAVRFCGAMMDVSKAEPIVAAADRSIVEVGPRTDPMPAPVSEPEGLAPAAESSVDTLEGDLRYALARRQLRVEYLPVIALATGHVQGLEALLRWAHPAHGVLGPERFMAFAEESGLIVPIGRWLLQEAGREFRRCVHFVDGLKLHLNLSPRQLQHPELMGDFEAVLAERGLAPHSLVLEIAESILQDDRHRPRIAELRQRGFGLSVDDFGTGTCTLDSLFRVPFDSLKIDRSFFGATPRSQAPQLVKSIVELARQTGAQAVAIGVETAEQLEFLRELGCPAAQGFHLSPPLDAEAARALLARSTCLARTA